MKMKAALGAPHDARRRPEPFAMRLFETGESFENFGRAERVGIVQQAAPKRREAYSHHRAEIHLISRLLAGASGDTFVEATDTLIQKAHDEALGGRSKIGVR